MVTAESVKVKLQGLIDTANAATGNADADLTAAVGALAAGFGQGMPTLYSTQITGATYFENHIIPDRETANTQKVSNLYASALNMKTVYVGKNVVCGTNCFNGCTALEEATVAGITGSEMFWNSKALRKCTFTETAGIDGNYTFDYCTALQTVIIRGDRVLPLSFNSIFVGCAQYNNAGGTGRIYVPRSQLEAYKVATNWTAFANKFLTIEDYPEITGG